MHVVITGASRGIGAALAAGYRARGAGVTGTARRAGAGLAPLDVADPLAFPAFIEALGGRAVDVLVCNAGINTGDASVDTGYPPADWAATFATNVTGVFLTVQNLLPNLRPGAKVAIVSSQMGSSERARGGDLIYRASKAAATNLGRNLAVDLRDRGIAVGIYHPGWVRTDMGGGGADLAPGESARGLIARIDALSPETSGTVETWDGRPLPY